MKMIQILEMNPNARVYFGIEKNHLRYLYTIAPDADENERVKRAEEAKCIRSFYVIAREKKSLSDVILGREQASVRRFFIGDPANTKLFVGNKELKRKKEITLTSKITVENLSFSLGSTATDVSDAPVIEVKALDVEKNGKILLHNINFSVQRGEFIAIMGPSGCGKTTLLKELAGENERKNGEIYIDTQSIYEHFHSKIKTRVGYVQQFDQLHPDLTVYQVLFFAAKIKDVVNARARIEQVQSDLKLTQLSGNLVRTLSGGQKKRVAIAVEILDQPELLILDEPTSPLDPESIKEFLAVLRKQARNFNRTIVMVTHKPSDLLDVDQVIFLSTGGYQVYTGNVSDFIPAMERKFPSLDGLDQEEKLLSVYKKFSVEATGKKFALHDTAKRAAYRESASFQKKFNAIHQWLWLFLRYLKVKFPDREKITINEVTRKKHFDGWQKNFFSLLLQPVLVGLLFFTFPNLNMTALFLISLAVIWFGINNGSKEIVEEIGIYKRERSYNLKLDAYLLSKIFALLILSFFQIIVLLSIVWFRYEFVDYGDQQDVNLYAPYPVAGFLLLLSLSSISLGLFVSTFSERVDKVLMWVPIVLIAQIIFSGLVSKPDTAYKENVSYFMLGRWGLEGLSRIQDDYSSKRIEKLPNKYDHKTSNSVVFEKTPLPPFDTIQYRTGGALELLASYNDNRKRDRLASWELFDSLEKNLLIILIHGVLAYILCRMVLLSKDYIPYYKSVNPASIKYGFALFILLILAVVLISPLLKGPAKLPRINPALYESIGEKN
jgi:ABC-type multidrug transport system ATPase subunit